MKNLFFLLLFILSASYASAQFTDRYWCFGDSAGIDFRNLNNPIPGESVLRSRGTCASICDSSGNLLFYCGDPHVDLWLQPGTHFLGMILNKNHEIMEGGDSLVGSSWYREMIILPKPGNTEQFYVFMAGITPTTNPGLYYCLVDLSYNGGLGRVIQKNIQLQSFPVCDGLAAVKHGNGRDWWLLFRTWNSSMPTSDYYSYLLTPQGMSGPFIQSIGLSSSNGFLRLDFSKSGKKISVIDADQNMEIMQFDRCTGQLSNPTPIHSATTGGLYWSSTFSPNESKLYMTEIHTGSGDSTSYLFQFDLNSLGGIFNSMDTLATFNEPSVAGFLQRGPDDKIYLSSYLEINDCEFFYLYCDTSYYQENMNIGVIHDPNVLGAGCNFQPFSFYLGGHRAYLGLPNNPNYELGADTLSLCDTIQTSVSEPKDQDHHPKLSVYYSSSWRTAFINASGIQGKEIQLCLTEASGKIIYQEKALTQDGLYTKDLALPNLAPGIYYATLFTEAGRVSTKFIVI
ncbi:MAG: T9SS type A sorting domain-containing protein [Bacteroidetes bacterium]|nr:T9SS type A sorting domain-containing protein [Bacteroidota bacterium]MBP6649637.1 T9SS type A sorting domain-containing protein [Bacteroidia bacterium]